MSQLINMGKIQVNFENNFVSFGKNRISYIEIEGFSFSYTKTKQQFHGITFSSSDSFKIKLKTKDKTYVLDSDHDKWSFFYLEWKEDLLGVFKKMVNSLDTFVKPVVMDRLQSEIRNCGFIKIAGLKFTPNSLERNRFFRGPEFLYLNDFFCCNYRNGYVGIHSGNEQKNKAFHAISLDEINAYLIPELINNLLSINGKVKANSRY